MYTKYNRVKIIGVGATQ